VTNKDHLRKAEGQRDQCFMHQNLTAIEHIEHNEAMETCKKGTTTNLRIIAGLKKEVARQKDINTAQGMEKANLERIGAEQASQLEVANDLLAAAYKEMADLRAKLVSLM
jgi:hypothetical protein